MSNDEEKDIIWVELDIINVNVVVMESEIEIVIFEILNVVEDVLK